jgi:hypothetical protein
MKDVFKELWDEIPRKAKIIGIIFVLGLVFMCVWASFCAKKEQLKPVNDVRNSVGLLY